MEDGVWRTVGGRRIFIKNGQELSDAMKESGKFGKKEIEQENSNDTNKITAYHGTTKDFEQFDEQFINTNKRLGDMPLRSGKGFYFSEDKELASSYGKLKEVELTIERPLRIKDYNGEKTSLTKQFVDKYENDNIEVYQYMTGMSKEDSYNEIYNYVEKQFSTGHGIVSYADSRSNGNYNDYVKIMDEIGYDGVINEVDKEIIVFQSKQIKIK